MFEQVEIKKKVIILLIITNCLSLFFLGYQLFYVDALKDTPTAIVRQNDVYVHILGEINQPNVYKVKKGTRLIELIELAGGATEVASLDQLNLSLILEDEMRITIPKVLAPDEQQTGDTCININTATVDELIELNGIGEVKAKAIVKYREVHGPFMGIEEIKFVSGIGVKTYEAISDAICT